MVEPGAPRNRSEVVERVGSVALVVHRPTRGQRFGEARGRFFVCVCTPIGHAELNERFTCALPLAAGTDRIQHATYVGDRALCLSRVGARCAAPLVNGEASTLIERIRMQLAERDGAIQPVQRIAHREQRLRTLSGEDEVVERLGPVLGALVVFRELRVVLVRGAVAAALERFGYRPMQQARRVPLMSR